MVSFALQEGIVESISCFKLISNNLVGSNAICTRQFLNFWLLPAFVSTSVAGSTTNVFINFDKCFYTYCQLYSWELFFAMCSLLSFLCLECFSSKLAFTLLTPAVQRYCENYVVGNNNFDNTFWMSLPSFLVVLFFGWELLVVLSIMTDLFALNFFLSL